MGTNVSFSCRNDIYMLGDLPTSVSRTPFARNFLCQRAIDYVGRQIVPETQCGVLQSYLRSAARCRQVSVRLWQGA